MAGEEETSEPILDMRGKKKRKILPEEDAPRMRGKGSSAFCPGDSFVALGKENFPLTESTSHGGGASKEAHLFNFSSSFCRRGGGGEGAFLPEKGDDRISIWHGEFSPAMGKEVITQGLRKEEKKKDNFSLYLR